MIILAYTSRAEAGFCLVVFPTRLCDDSTTSTATSVISALFGLSGKYSDVVEAVDVSGLGVESSVGVSLASSSSSFPSPISSRKDCDWV